jgi:hypothetical protein
VREIRSKRSEPVVEPGVVCQFPICALIKRLLCEQVRMVTLPRGPIVFQSGLRCSAQGDIMAYG